jgi:predicted NodU family carbamoyl transferase
MRVLGLSGLFSTEEAEYPPDVSPAFFHDAAACLVEDGRIVAAVEEERVSRDKHTNRFPIGAVAECLEIAGLRLPDIDTIGYFFDDAFTDRELMLAGLYRPDLPLLACQDLILTRLSEGLRAPAPVGKIFSARHHESHAATAYFHSGFEPALVVVMDGNGENESTSVFAGRGGVLRPLHTYPRNVSLGHYYTLLTRFAGYQDFDEYKVMGLAPYGNPERFADLFAETYQLEQDGEFQLDVDGLASYLLDRGIRPRRSAEPMTAVYRDLAAAGQCALERIARHVIEHWAAVTGLPCLCLAGGVAQNTSLNGRLLSSGSFRGIYVHPAPHDAGAAMGAALLAVQRAGGTPQPLPDVYLGRDIGSTERIERTLHRWRDQLNWTVPDDLAAAAASLLADGEVIGWAQGRAEFGPRALGNRSLFADPRPTANRDRVNRLIKQREGYRPFAPVVAEADAARFFDLPDATADYGYMGFVIDVRPEYRDQLAAVTHVDGTARVQVLRPGANPALARLLAEFGSRTGVPVLLNTSFNNYAEPIVHTVEDAIVCLLTTGLSALAVGPFLVRRRAAADELPLGALRISLMPHCDVVTVWSAAGRETMVRRRSSKRYSLVVSERLGRLVAEGGTIDGLGLPPGESAALAGELGRLWDRRLIRLTPVA